MKIRKKMFDFFFNNLPLKNWTLKCSLNSLTLHFCRYDESALPTPVLNLATYMYEVHSKSSRTGWISKKVDVLSF